MQVRITHCTAWDQHKKHSAPIDTVYSLQSEPAYNFFLPVCTFEMTSPQTLFVSSPLQRVRHSLQINCAKAPLLYIFIQSWCCAAHRVTNLCQCFFSFLIKQKCDDIGLKQNLCFYESILANGWTHNKNLVAPKAINVGCLCCIDISNWVHVLL